ncbi:MAG: hypothetical protein GZ089_08250 [Aromatoleum sp.]|nr:hypothetical protein [Aromatoleum sp.]
MAPFVVLMVLPVLIGVISELHFRDTKNASLAAAVGSVLNVCLFVQILAPEGSWSWLAALLVSPLPVAFAVAAVFICHGRSNRHRRTDGQYRDP